MADMMDVEEYQVWLGRPLSDSEQGRAEKFLGAASALVSRISEGELDSSSEVGEDVKAVIYAMVTRARTLPPGKSSESIGDYRWTGGGGIYATREEVEVIRASAGVSSVFEIELTSPTFQDLLLESQFPPHERQDQRG